MKVFLRGTCLDGSGFWVISWSFGSVATQEIREISQGFMPFKSLWEQLGTCVFEGRLSSKGKWSELDATYAV